MADCNWIILTFVMCFLMLQTSLVEAQKVAPDMPSEYFCDIIQSKWNFNGFGVNHTGSLTQYSSHSQLMLRTDATYFESGLNVTGQPPPNLGAGFSSSLLDYNTPNVVVNTFFEKDGLGVPSSCYVSHLLPTQSFPPPPSSSWLRDHHAIYAGQAFLELYGKADRWSLIFYNTTATFYFVPAGAAQPSLVRYDFVSYSTMQGEVAAITYLFNMFQQKIPPGVFAGSGNTTCGEPINTNTDTNNGISNNSVNTHNNLNLIGENGGDLNGVPSVLRASSKNLFFPPHGIHKWVELLFGDSPASSV